MSTDTSVQRRKQLMAELKELDQEDEKEKKEYVESKLAAWRKIEQQYEWECVKIITRDNNNNQVNGIMVNRRVNKGLFSEFVQEWGLLYDNCWRGAVFFRTDENILTSVSGGCIVLNIPKLCNDTEWNLIVSGKIPEKFIKH